ncbi:MAG TPA: GvpL/GvpF family gas vesicle protein [Thermoanaerobaculia bacterium]|nr:GvpL/GvpF family gas vesicle protein [Thermoanaerobaculia bacterium]
MSGLYLYALVDEEPGQPLGQGLAGEPLRVVRSGEILAVAGERPSRPAPGVHAFSHHDGTVRRLAACVPALLPARFGEWFPDEQALADKLAPRAKELGEALELVRGCVQMTLRVFGEATVSPSGSVVEESGLGPGARYLEERRREHERARSLPEIDPLRELLAPYLRTEKVERRGTPPMLGTVYHLVPRESFSAYRAVLERESEQLSGVRVQASGPWPPYAFAPGATP